MNNSAQYYNTTNRQACGTKKTHGNKEKLYFFSILNEDADKFPLSLFV